MRKRFQFAQIVLILAIAAVVTAFLLSRQSFETSDIYLILTLIPAVSCGWLFGWRGGLAGSFFITAFYYGLFFLNNRFYLRGEIIFGIITIGVGTLVGWLRDLAAQLKQQSQELHHAYDQLVQEAENHLRTEGELLASEERYRRLIELSPDAVLVIQEEKVVFANTTSARLYGADQADNLIGKSYLDLIAPEHHLLTRGMLSRAQRQSETSAGEQHCRLDGKTFYADVNAAPVPFPGQPAVLIITRDVTFRINTEERLKHLATHDPLTNLPNRALLNDRLEHAITLSKRQGHSVAVIFLDLDGFKYVNDTFGHETGDRILKEVAYRLQCCVRESDTLARMGGDEFAFVLENVSGREGVKIVAERIQAVLGQPLQKKDTPFLSPQA